MQKQGNDFQGPGICNRLFNFIMISLIGRGLKRLTNYQRPVGGDEYANAARNGKLQQPLTITSQPNSYGSDENRVNSKKDLDPIVKIQFKQTEEELEDWTPVQNHNLGSSDTTAMEKTIIIPIADRTGQNKKKKEGPNLAKPIQPDASTPMLTGLGLNINEISEAFIQNKKEKMTRDISLADSERI